MRKLISVLVIACLVIPNSIPVVYADDSDIFGRNVQPNVLILLDSSGSMEDEIVSSTYVPATAYTVQNRCRVGSSNNQPCTAVKVWKYSNSRYTEYAATISAVNSSSARTALTNNGYWSGTISGSSVELYVGNYLNYYLSASYVVEPKITIAKRVITTLLNNTEGVRFGLMKFGSNSGTIVSPIGTATATMVTALNAINVTGTTPLGEQVRDAGKYFKGTLSTYASPIELACQPNFIIVVSDGDWNGSVNPKTEATNRRTQDHLTTTGFPGTQNVFVHTVSFGTSISADGLADLQTMATNGGGNYYNAADSTQLEDSLQAAIRQIATATFTFASPVIPTTSTTGSSKIYMAAFQTDAVTPFWHGYLKAYNRNSSGQVPVDSDGIPLSSSLAWEAGALLAAKAASTRTMYTVSGGALTTFTKTNSAITNSMLAAASTTEHDKIIDFTRGIDSYDEDSDGNTTEERAWKLGDIFHSNPVLVSPPFLPLADSTYTTFRTTNASRTTILLAGANDGQLHAFQESDGQELWSFIPADNLARLKNLAVRSAEHEFYLDASPIVTDIKVGSTWKTIAIFGQRRGGENYYALDITNTSSPTYLWSFADSKMGETWSEPAVGKVLMSDGTAKYVAFFGGGYDTPQNNSSGKAFFVIDLATGSKLWEYYNSASTNDRQYMNFSLAANPAVVDTDGDGYINRVYIGDVGGQMWKFDVSAAATVASGLVTNWTGKRFFAAASSQTNPPATGEYYPTQAIYATPTMTVDSGGNLWIYFGTGDRNHPNNTGTNRFYGIKDNTNMTNGSLLTESNLANVTTTYQTITQGWYITLGTDEKVMASANVFNSQVFFSGFTPGTTATCLGGGGVAKLYAVQMATGYAGVDWSSGTAITSFGGSAGVSLTSADSARSVTVGTGIATKPIVIISQTGATVTSTVIAATTDQQLLSNAAPPPALKRIRYWREVR
jgi:type IV pilus assembly protein PilY1